MRWVMRSKLHNAVVTEANLAYVGSITIDEDLLDAVGLWPGEKVLVVSNTSGAQGSRPTRSPENAARVASA